MIMDDTSFPDGNDVMTTISTTSPSNEGRSQQDHNHNNNRSNSKKSSSVLSGNADTSPITGSRCAVPSYNHLSQASPKGLYHNNTTNESRDQHFWRWGAAALAAAPPSASNDESGGGGSSFLQVRTKPLSGSMTIGNDFEPLCFGDFPAEGMPESCEVDSLLQPTPINESSPSICVVTKLPLLSESLIAQRQILGEMLRPLQQLAEESSALPPQLQGYDLRQQQHHYASSCSPATTTTTATTTTATAGTADTIATSHFAKTENSRSNRSHSINSHTESSCESSTGSTVCDHNSMEEENINDNDDIESCLRVDHTDQWMDRYNELILYKNKYHHCNVPYDWAPNQRLSQWVKRQRHQYKLKTQGKHSNMSGERQALLESLGFVWDSRAANWESRLNDLKAYRKRFGHVQVSAKNPSHRSLAVWLKRQRQSARRLQSGHPNAQMTQQQLAQLLELGVKLNSHLAKKT